LWQLRQHTAVFGTAAFAEIFVDFTKDTLLARAFGVVDASESFALTLEAFALS
jgi:hypothetical protein